MPYINVSCEKKYVFVVKEALVSKPALNSVSDLKNLQGFPLSENDNKNLFSFIYVYFQSRLHNLKIAVQSCRSYSKTLPKFPGQVQTCQSLDGKTVKVLKLLSCDTMTTVLIFGKREVKKLISKVVVFSSEAIGKCFIVHCG